MPPLPENAMLLLRNTTRRRYSGSIACRIEFPGQPLLFVLGIMVPLSDDGASIFAAKCWLFDGRQMQRANGLVSAPSPPTSHLRTRSVARLRARLGAAGMRTDSRRALLLGRTQRPAMAAVSMRSLRAASRRLSQSVHEHATAVAPPAIDSASFRSADCAPCAAGRARAASDPRAGARGATLLPRRGDERSRAFRCGPAGSLLRCLPRPCPRWKLAALPDASPRSCRSNADRSRFTPQRSRGHRVRARPAGADPPHVVCGFILPPRGRAHCPILRSGLPAMRLRSMNSRVTFLVSGTSIAVISRNTALNPA